MLAPWSVQEFEQQLRAKGQLYHIHHPFHVAMNNGLCTQKQIQGWVANRYYYQVMIPRKDAAIMANCPDASVRKQWLQRILDHDGHDGDVGGIEAWLSFTGEGAALSEPVAGPWSFHGVMLGLLLWAAAWPNRGQVHSNCSNN